MIHLHYSNRLEALISPLAGAIEAQQRAHPLERVTIVVPNRAMETFIKHRVAEAIGIAANLSFTFLRQFLADMIQGADPEIRVLDVDQLEVVLFQTLRGILRTDDQHFAALRSYVEAPHATETDKEVRTYRLATQLARLFREYSISRRSMLQKWNAGYEAAEDSASIIAQWQRRLWNMVFDRNGTLREKSSSSGKRWMMLPEAFETVPRSNLRATLPQNVHVFGLAYAGPAYARIFSLIGSLTELHLLTVNPCLEFWEDVDDLSRPERASWIRRHSKLDHELEESSDPFNLVAVEDTPALRLWARPGREYLRMLNELTECDFEAHFAHHHEFSTILASLQEDILNRAPQKASAEYDLSAGDESIKFLACPGIAREAEIVANEIWSMLEQKASDSHPLRFHQIAVMVPDASYKSYLPHLQSAFSRLHQLPVNLVTHATDSNHRVLEAVHLLVRLPLSRFTRDDLLHLLNSPAIGSDAQFSAEQASRWCAEAGILFGADESDLSQTYIPRDSYHWDQGLKRLALGVLMDADRDDDPRYFHSADSIEYLPSPPAQDEGAAATAFIKLARRLLRDSLEIRSHRVRLDRWSTLLSNFISNYVRGDTPDDKRVRDRCTKAIESIGAEPLTQEPVAYSVVHELVASRIRELDSQIAHFTERGIAIGPLSSLRAIPFRAIFVLGLNETVFPARESNDPIDLRFTRRHAGDVTPIERDRYLFLEALLAARERICFSYVATDLQAGSDLEPASVVRELQFILGNYITRDNLGALTIEHPLSRYDRRYFPEFGIGDVAIASDLKSYDRDARRGAAASALRDDLVRHCGQLELPGRDEPMSEQLSISVSRQMRPILGDSQFPLVPTFDLNEADEIWLPVSSLRRFLECPLQGAAQFALGLFDDDDDQDLTDFDDEPIAQSILSKTNLLRRVFWASKADPQCLEESYRKALRVVQLRGEAPVGPLGDAAQKTDLDTLRHWMAQADNARCGPLDAWQDLRLGRGNTHTSADRVLHEMSFVLPGGSGAASNRVVKLFGSLGPVSSAGTASMRLLVRDEPKPKHFLGPMLTAMVLAASEELTDGGFRAILVGAGKKKAWQESRALSALTKDIAYDYLLNLISDLLVDRNHYFLPIEAVEKANKEFARGHGDDVLDSLNDLREDEFASCSSDYGPIRNARRFEIPNIETIKRLIDRRFRLIYSIFERAKD